MNGCYIFKSGEEIMGLSLELLCISRLRFVIKESKEYNFYKFYGLDPDVNEPKLEDNLLDYFSKDVIYPPRNMHPALEVSNKTLLKKYPILIERISKIQVVFLEKNLNEIQNKDYEKLFF